MSDSTLRIYDRLDPDLANLLALCSHSTKLCAQTFFPERFRATFSPIVHDPIFNLIDSGYPYIAIAAPRGSGKTSIVGLAYAARQILFNLSSFLVYVSTSFDVAQRQTENLKTELLANLPIKQLFGNVKISQEAPDLDQQFSSRSWIAYGRTLVLPRGSGQQVRGLLFNNARPDCIIVDDLEDAETMGNDEIRARRKEWFFADLLKIVSRIHTDTFQFIYIDTLKHQDALLEDLLNSAEWKSVRLELCDDNLTSNIPSFISDERIKREYEHHREMGQLDVFAREYRNLPISVEDATFKQEYFKYYEEADLARIPRIETFVIVDPAKTVKLHSADSAIVAVGFDATGRSIFVRDVEAGKFHPDDLIHRAFAMCARFGAKVLGVEVTSLNEFITQPIRNEMMAQGLFFELVELKPRAKKEDRVAAMVPYYRQGYIYHNRTCSHKLEQQLLAFPRPKLWDVMDAFAYFVEMLDLGGRFFEPPPFEDEEDEFLALQADTEPRCAGEWRYV